MRFTAPVGFTALVLSVGLLLSAALPASGYGDGSAHVSILFDLGDGTYVWTSAEVLEPEAPNATWDAVLDAAARNGLSVEWAWFGSFGVGILDVGDRNPPAGFAGLYRWNGTARSWEFTDVGVSSLVLVDGEVIALYNAAFGADFSSRFPVPTPIHPHPSASFRGDLANTGTSPSWGPATNRVHWDADLGVVEIGATPAVAYGRVYVTTIEGLNALDGETGEVLWSNERIRGFSSPAVFNGALLVGGADGRVYELDAATGEEIWNTTLLASTGFSGITSSPKVSFDHVYVGTFNESGGPGEVAALWVSNGTVAWRHETTSVHFSSPAVADGTVYVGLMGRYNTTTQITFDPPFGVLGLDGRTGEPRADFAVGGLFPTGGPVAASPVVAGGLLFAASKDGRIHAIDRTDGRERWNASVEAGVSSPAFHRDVLFVGGGAFGEGGGRVTALNATTGAILWTASANGPVQSSIAYADGKLYFATNTAQGTIYAVDAASGSTLWTYVPQPAQFILGSPVVADGTLYAPSDNGHVIAFRDPPESSGPSGFLGGPVGIALAVGAGVAVTIAVAAIVLRTRGKTGGP